jgi:phosphoenolpyruvate carboxykinase (ATP)
MSNATMPELDLSPSRVSLNLTSAELVEIALARGEGKMAANGALVACTGDRTGRSPKDKYLEEESGSKDNIWWGKVNQPMSSEHFELAQEIATEYMNAQDRLFMFEGFVGADPKYRMSVRVVMELAWANMFCNSLFIKQGSPAAGGPNSEPFKRDWTVIVASGRRLTEDEQKRFGVNSPVLIAQSLARKTVVVIGSEYAGEIKKSIFYAMNYDMPDVGVFPMHCSANIGKSDPDNVALFFGLSGTGKTTLSADPDRRLIGDDEHGWSDRGVFNFEGGCYAKCIHLTEEGEPQIWNAIRFGSVLENMVMNDQRIPDFDDTSITENTRVTYPVDYIPGAVIPSVGTHPRNVIFLTADAYGVLPPVSRLTREQAEYYFINGYTSKLAGTEAGVTEPQPNFSPCFGGPFMPRPPARYAEMLAERIDKHGANVWLLNTGWTGGPHGEGERFKLAYTRAMVTAILDGTLNNADFETEPVFGLHIPKAVPNVPAEVLRPRNTWSDGAAYDAKAAKLAGMFRENDAKFEMADEVRAAGPKT